MRREVEEEEEEMQQDILIEEEMQQDILIGEEKEVAEEIETQQAEMAEIEVEEQREQEHLTMATRRALKFKKYTARKSILNQLSNCGFSRIDGFEIIGDHKKLPPKA